MEKLNITGKEDYLELSFLFKSFSKSINKHLERIQIIEKELKVSIEPSRLDSLILATKLIGKDLDDKSFPLSKTVEHNIDKIYKANFNSKEEQLRQAVIELKRCSKLIKDYHYYYGSYPWGSIKYRNKCKKQGIKSDSSIEKALDIKQEVKLKQIEFRLVKERQALIKEKSYLLSISKKIGKLLDRDIEAEMTEILNNMKILDKSIYINKKAEEKKILKEAYILLYRALENTDKKGDE